MASYHHVTVTVNIRNPWLMSFFVALLVISFRISDTECGKVNFFEVKASVRGAWPSIVMVKGSETETVICPGTLISKKHVLVAAGCTYNLNKHKAYSPEELVVFLGASDLSSTNEEGVVRANVTEIHVHPDWLWDVFRKRSEDADLAILVLGDDITFTDYIRPVRLPAADDVAINSLTVDVVGTAAGLDLDKDVITQDSVRAFNCDRTNPAFVSNETGRIFCTEIRNFGGFFVRTDDTWVQYGVLCNTYRETSNRRDDVAVYTNIKLFTNWIAETIKLSESGAVNQTGFVSVEEPNRSKQIVSNKVNVH